MANVSRIHPGRRVSGNHGPLVASPNGSGKHQVRSNAFGTVTKAVGQHKWEVVFDFNGQTKVVKSKSLKIVMPESGIPLNEQTELQEVC